MPASLESSRPIMAPSTRTSVRFSTYSMAAPSVTPTVLSTDSVTAEIRPIVDGLERLKNPHLSEQRVFLNEEKTTKLAKLALGAKLERALDRRMTSQDAVMRPRKPSVLEVTSEKEKM
ncbi:hypothetical protein CHGG_07382 [Chaetomium globosum CBS 148.51]|jgi:hypothetical protein|uniref:Uncharacterized protein n=1 Tax=Chaetomium globosum (strain ATCC 6205 / CBS 148.51 / DSM 1962 / NBRC 6347 / NRRL 1970) TaxID=306901 RepID=Q2GXC2_CHAGB|nr:uncharacterized protein CHGG_07382 [Chaetomium globosum CBS 148.51]EAQ86129.1 hypothetical protein CHGG_07382 [Chaetomium globosum CBS 148.51]